MTYGIYCVQVRVDIPHLESSFQSGFARRTSSGTEIKEVLALGLGEFVGEMELCMTADGEKLRALAAACIMQTRKILSA